MKRTLTLLMLLLALLALLVLPAAAADLPRLVDNADLLMADDAEALLADLDSRSEALQFDIVIVTVDSLDGETPRNYAEDFFWYNNYGLGEDRDGALLLVAMDTRDWYIATHGFGITAITPAGREAMVDRFLPQLSNAEYAAAFSTFAEECEDYVNQARNGSAYDTGNLPDEPFEAPGFLWVVACLLFGALIGGITVGVMAAGEQHRWNYVSALRNETALPRGQRCTIGFTWKRNRFAIIVNDTVFPEADVGRPPAWGPTFHFGGAGTFPGRLYEVRAYCKSAL